MEKLICNCNSEQMSAYDIIVAPAGYVCKKHSTDDVIVCTNCPALSCYGCHIGKDAK